MFKRKNVLVAVAVSVLLAACGGGGDDAPSVSAGGTGTPSGGGSNNGATTGTFAGTYTLANDQILYAPTTAGAVTLAQLAAAPIGPFANGTSSAVAQAGFRLSSPTLPAGTAAGVKQDARMAVSFVEKAASVGAGEAAEALQVVVPVTFTTVNNTDGTQSATIAPTANGNAFIYYKPKTGAAQNISVPAAGLIKLSVDPADTTSQFVSIDLDAAVTKAGAAFASSKDISGSFDMATVLSNVSVKSEAGAALPTTNVTVTGSNQAAVSGSGVAGTILINQ